MTSAELRFWKNRLRNADAFSNRSYGTSGNSREKRPGEAETTGASRQPDASGGASRSFRPPDARSSAAAQRQYEKRVEAAAALGLPLEKVLSMTDHELQKESFDKLFAGIEKERSSKQAVPPARTIMPQRER